MNRQRRALLHNAAGLLREVSGMLSKALDDEQDCLDNMPENLLYSEKCEKMEDAINKLEEAVEQVDFAKECIEAATA